MSGARGFTLIEISVALVIGALVLAIAAPALSRLNDRVRFNARLQGLEDGIAALPRLAYATGDEGSLQDLAERHLEGLVAFLWERRAVRFLCHRLLLLGVWPGLPGTLLGDPLPPERELRWPHQSRGLGGDGSQPTEGV